MDNWRRGTKVHEGSTSIGYCHLELHAVRESRETYCRAEKNPRAEAVVTGNQFTEMAPPKETMPIPKKSQTRAQTIEPEVEETLGASSSEPRFP
jgi:hypothetical protein